MNLPLRITRKPDFGRLRKALLSQGEPDCVPFIELGIHPIIKDAILGRPCRSVADEIAFSRATGYDYVKIQPMIALSPPRDSYEADPQVTQTVAGVQRRWASEHKGIISSWEDFERHPWPKPEEVNYSRLEEACRILPDDMGIIGQYGDIYTFIWEAFGFENFAMKLYEDPDLVAAMFDKVGGLIYGLFETMSSMDRVQALWYSDDLAYTGGPMIDPQFYRDLLFPWVRRMGDLCKKRNMPFLYHSDGVLWDVIPDLMECGVTALHPIEPKSMDVGEVKERFKGRLALCGSVELDLLCRGSREEVAEMTKDRLRRAAPGGGYCLGSSNSVPEYASVENYAVMLETGDRYGAYPISV